MPFSAVTFIRPAVASMAMISILCISCTQAHNCQNPILSQVLIKPSQTGQEKPSQLTPFDLERTHETLVDLEESLSRDGGDARGETLAKLAHLYFIMGEFSEYGDKSKSYDRGRYFAELLRDEHPDRVEGHYWLALNLCGLCETGGTGSALIQIPKIVKLLESAVKIDQTYDQGGPLRVLGYIRFKTPSWPLSEGNITEALNLLSTAVEIAPNNSTNHLYLAEVLMNLDRVQEAFLELNRVLASTEHSISADGFSEDRKQALTMIGQCMSSSRDFQMESHVSTSHRR